tara:strand:- start:1084 stop:1506 length:423 start_codon:yes stop_codon:yes gene_type:complete
MGALGGFFILVLIGGYIIYIKPDAGGSVSLMENSLPTFIFISYLCMITSMSYTFLSKLRIIKAKWWKGLLISIFNLIVAPILLIYLSLIDKDFSLNYAEPLKTYFEYVRYIIPLTLILFTIWFFIGKQNKKEQIDGANQI